MSPRGSLMVIASVPSPARLEHAGDLAGGGQLAHCDARQLELAVVAARPARHRAAVAHPRRRGVARHLGQLQLRLEALLAGCVAVARDRLQAFALRRFLPGELGAPIVLFDRAFLSHGKVRIRSPSLLESVYAALSNRRGSARGLGGVAGKLINPGGGSVPEAGVLPKAFQM